MNDLFQSAVKLKQAEVDQQRRKFAAAPAYYQSTAFHSDAVAAMRDSEQHSVEERLLYSKARRAEGNECVAQGRLAEAKQRYEEAYSVFCYISKVGEEWRKGLKDSDLRFCYLSDEESRNAEVKAHVAGVLCNIAVVCGRLRMLDEARAAAREVLGQLGCADHLKAAYLLAKLLAVDDPSATSVSVEQAVAVLQPVVRCWEALPPCKLAQDAKVNLAQCSELLARLAAEKTELCRRDRARFSGLFDRAQRKGESSDDADDATPVASAQPPQACLAQSQSKLGGTWYEQAEQCWNVIASLRAEGREAEAASMEAQLRDAACQKLMAEGAKPLGHFDFMQPSPELLLHAQKLRLDLSDQLVLDELSKLRQQHFCEQEVDAMNIADVETELLARGALGEREPQFSWHDMRAQTTVVAGEEPLYRAGFDYGLASLSQRGAPPHAEELRLREELKTHRAARPRSASTPACVGM